MARECISETPAELEIHFEPRPPEPDPTLGIPVVVDRTGTPAHRLVTIGDSVTQGFMSGAIFRTDLSWPAMVAHELGFGAAFRFPTYEPPDGPGGLPLDLERLARAIEDAAGPTLSWRDVLRTARRVRSYMDRIEDYWERGPGSRTPPAGPPPFHNLAVYGWDLLDTLTLDSDRLQARIAAGAPKDDIVRQIVENDNDRAGLVVTQRARTADGKAATVLQAAAALGEERVRRRTGHRDAGRHAGRQQRPRIGRPPRGVLEQPTTTWTCRSIAGWRRSGRSRSGGPRTSRPSGPMWSPRCGASAPATSSWPPSPRSPSRR